MDICEKAAYIKGLAEGLELGRGAGMSVGELDLHGDLAQHVLELEVNRSGSGLERRGIGIAVDSCPVAVVDVGIFDGTPKDIHLLVNVAVDRKGVA